MRIFTALCKSKCYLYTSTVKSNILHTPPPTTTDHRCCSIGNRTGLQHVSFWLRTRVWATFVPITPIHTHLSYLFTMPHANTWQLTSNNGSKRYCEGWGDIILRDEQCRWAKKRKERKTSHTQKSELRNKSNKENKSKTKIKKKTQKKRSLLIIVSA